MNPIESNHQDGARPFEKLPYQSLMSAFDLGATAEAAKPNAFPISGSTTWIQLRAQGLELHAPWTPEFLNLT